MQSVYMANPATLANSDDGWHVWNPMNPPYPQDGFLPGGVNMSFRLTKWVGTTAAAGVSAFTIFSGTAAGFFPPIPTGNDPPTVAPQVPVVPPVIVSPPTVQPIVPVVPPPFIPVVPKEVPTVPPVVPPDCDCNTHTPECIPEPATVLTGLVGLSLLGIGAAKRKFGKKKSA